MGLSCYHSNTRARPALSCTLVMHGSTCPLLLVAMRPAPTAGQHLLPRPWQSWMLQGQEAWRG